ncbi:MAG: hypothetical protein NVS2B9_01090 [Myxococcales bacterium]
MDSHPTGQLPPIATAGRKVGEFVLREPLGEGGHGVVWRAEQPHLQREVVVKVLRLRGDSLRHPQREALLGVRIDHPYAAHVYGAGVESDGLVWIAMERVQGRSLHQWLRDGPMPLAQFVPLFERICEVVQAAHDRGLVHRDLKPANVMVLERSGQLLPKLLDFEIARALGEIEAPLGAPPPDEGGRLFGTTQPMTTRGGSGSPAYMAPEQWRDASAADAQTDLYALGVLAYEAVCGRRPFEAQTLEGISAQHATAPAPPVGPNLPAALDGFLTKALAKDPAARFRSALELGRALREVAGPEETRRPASPRSRRAAVFAGIGLLAAALAGAFLLSRRPAGATSARPSVAVLPFVNLTSDREQDTFSQGVAEEILNALAQVPGLRVSGRASSFFFKDKAIELAKIGQQLDVGTVLQGSVRKSGNRVRVTAQMTEVAGGTQLWSQTYDRELTDIFAVQDEIAASVVAALQVKLLAGQAPTTRQYRTANIEVYNQYLLGQRFFGLESRDGLGRAIDAFENALALQPDYAPAQAGLAFTLLFTKSKLYHQRSLAAARRAVELAPDLAEAWAIRGKARSWIARDWAGARADLEHAVRLNPNDPQAQQHYAALLVSLGRLQEGIAAQRRATELDPLRGNAWQLLAYWYLIDGQHGPGRSALERALQINPDSEALPDRQFESFIWAGQPTEALAALRRGRRPCLPCEAMVEHDLGHAAESQRKLDDLIANQGATEAYWIACVYAWRRETDRAFEWLVRALSQDDVRGLAFVKVDPYLRHLHGDPRFRQVLEKMNLPASP